MFSWKFLQRKKPIWIFYVAYIFIIIKLTLRIMLQEKEHKNAYRHHKNTYRVYYVWIMKCKTIFCYPFFQCVVQTRMEICGVWEGELFKLMEINFSKVRRSWELKLLVNLAGQRIFRAISSLSSIILFVKHSNNPQTL